MAHDNGKPFHLLVTDDDPAFIHVLRSMVRNLLPSWHLHWAKDGLDALDFLHRRNSHGGAPVPHLILMDIDMPRMNGLLALKAIRADPALSAIPVLMLSSSVLPEVVGTSYEFHANAYLRKPAELGRLGDFLRVIEAFWTDFALLPPQTHRPVSARSDMGITIASHSPEDASQAMPDSEAGSSADLTARSDCEEQHYLMEQFAFTVRELVNLHEQQFQAIVQGDLESNRFDLLIHMANEKKQSAKYAYLRHVESHGCANTNAIVNASRT